MFIQGKERLDMERIAKVSEAMVEAHKKHPTMMDAIQEVESLFSDVPQSVLIMLWCGVNAKSTHTIVESTEFLSVTVSNSESEHVEIKEAA